MNYCIYMHINQINNKKYIGQTCQKPEYRWNHGKGYKESPYFYQAILKYGWENFDHIILKDNLSLEEANNWEKYFIQYYNTTNPDYGYNSQKGGENHSVNQITKIKCSQLSKERWKDPDYRKRMSNAMKEKWKDPQYRAKVLQARQNNPRTISEQGRQNISNARKLYIAQHGTPTQGKGHTKEAREKIRQSKLGSKNPQYGKPTSEYQKQRVKEVHSKKIQCIETGQIFASQKEAALWAGLSNSNGISDYLAGRKRSAGKHPDTKIKLHWLPID